MICQQFLTELFASCDLPTATLNCSNIGTQGNEYEEFGMAVGKTSKLVGDRITIRHNRYNTKKSYDSRTPMGGPRSFPLSPCFVVANSILGKLLCTPNGIAKCSVGAATSLGVHIQPGSERI
jgi:hypothetical protein